MFAKLLCASAVTLLGFAVGSPSSLRAQALTAAVAEEADWSAVEATVRQEIAQRWDVDSDRVVLEWGPRAGMGVLNIEVAPELVGNGTNGQWVVRVQSARGVVGIRIRGGATRTVPIATQMLRRGHIVGVEDIRFDTQTVWGAPETHGPMEDMTGWEVERTLSAGSLLAEPAVRPPSVVRTGETVEVLWSTGPVRLTLVGRALGTVRAGESVLVRLETGKRLRGIAETNGTVSVSQLSPSEIE